MVSPMPARPARRAGTRLRRLSVLRLQDLRPASGHHGRRAPRWRSNCPNQSHFFNETSPRKRLNPAGPDHAQIASASGIVDYLETVAQIAGTNIVAGNPWRKAHNAMRAQEIILLRPLLDYLRKKNGVRLLGPSDPAPSAPTVAIDTSAPRL